MDLRLTVPGKSQFGSCHSTCSSSNVAPSAPSAIEQQSTTPCPSFLFPTSHPLQPLRDTHRGDAIALAAQLRAARSPTRPILSRLLRVGEAHLQACSPTLRVYEFTNSDVRHAHNILARPARSRTGTPTSMLALIDTALGLPWSVYAAILLASPPLLLLVVRAPPARKPPRPQPGEEQRTLPPPPQLTHSKHQQANRRRSTTPSTTSPPSPAPRSPPRRPT